MWWRREGVVWVKCRERVIRVIVGESSGGKKKRGRAAKVKRRNGRGGLRGRGGEGIFGVRWAKGQRK
jgi:hypothetical protein